MRIDPPKRRLSKLVGLVIAPDGSDPVVLGEWGVSTIAGAPSCAIMYAHRKRDAYAVVRRGNGRLRRWKHNIVAYEIDGRKIRSLRGYLEKYDPAEALGYLIAWADWVRARGGNPGTFSGSSMGMLRASLERPVFIREPSFNTETLLLGARIEKSVDRGRYDFVSRWDISAAYPHAMTTTPIPRRYSEVAHASVNDDGFAYADVTVPDLPWGPLPYRTKLGQLFPVGGEITGVWHLRELRAAAESGCTVNIRRAWIGRGRVDLFTPYWRETMEMGRGLPGIVGALAKATLNALWGSFAISGAGEWWSFPNGTGFVSVKDAREVHPRSLAVAANVTSRVRERLYREALAEDVFILGCHTDGVLCEQGVTFSPETGKLGGWRLKDTGWYVDFFGPQMYRMMRLDGQLEYVMSGMSQDRAPKAFAYFLREDRELRLLDRHDAVASYRERARARFGEVVG